MLYLVVTSLIWAFSFPLIKTYLAGYDPTAVAFFRLLFSFLSFLPFIRRPNRDQFQRQFAIGAIQFGIMYVLYIQSYQYLEGHEIAILTISTPVYVVLFTGILRRRWSLRYGLAAGLVLVGSGLLVPLGVNPETQVKGVLLVQGANICFAIGQVLQKKWAPSNLVSGFAWSYLGGLAVPLVVLLVHVGHGAPFPRPWNTLSPHAFFTLLYLGVIASGLGFFLWNQGVCRVNAGLTAVMNNLKIPLAVLVSLIFFNEVVHIPRVIVSLVIFALALKLVMVRSMNKDKPESTTL